MSFKKYLQARSIYTGSEWRLRFLIESSAPVVFPTTAKFKCQFRERPDGKVLAELTSQNGGVIRVGNNSLEIYLKGTHSRNWTAQSVLADIIRTDLSQNVHLGFTLKVPVTRSITQV